MNILVSIKGEQRAITLEGDATARDAVNAACLHPSGTLVMRQRKSLPSDAPLEDGDELTLIPVASGG